MSRPNAGITREELILMSRQFAAMLDAGIDILRILDVLREQFNNPKAKAIFTSVEKDMRLGRLLSTALGRYPEVFSPFYVSMIRQGERDESLAQAFNRLAEHISRPVGITGGWDDQAMGNNPSLHMLVDRVTPIAFWLALSSAATIIAIAALWYATNSGILQRDALGPNICLLVGVFILVSSLIFARLRPRQWVSCSFCGRSQQVAAFMRRSANGAICDACIESSYLAWQAERPKEESPVVEQQTTESGSQAETEKIVDEENDGTADDEFQVVKNKEEYY